MTDWDHTFLEIAEVIAKRSTCMKRQTAAIIVKDNRIIGAGYNGSPSGMPHCKDIKVPLELHYDWSRFHEVHAELNAICYSAKEGIGCAGAEMYCLVAPCSACAFAIVSAGIKKITFKHPYRDANGLLILEACGVAINQFSS